MSDDDGIRLHIADAQSNTMNISTTNSQDTKKKKKTPVKKRTLNSLIPENVQEGLKQGERILIKTEKEFSVSSSAALFSDSKVAELNDLLAPPLLKNLHQFMGIEKLTRIQDKSLQPFLTGKDLLMKSETGSGKTLAYVIPLVQALFNYAHGPNSTKISREQGTFAIILAPTRELCIQIQQVVQKVCIPFPWMVEGTLMGGEKKKAEKSRLRKGVTVLIATPGRLEDHLMNTQSFKFDMVRHIILDEADRLLDLGFDKTIKNIVQILRQRTHTRPQTVLISATLHRKIQQLATSIDVMEPNYIGFTEGNSIEERKMDLNKEHMASDIFTIPKNLDQYYVESPSKVRLAMLVGFLKWKCEQKKSEYDKLKMVVFLSCCDSVEFHHTLFTTVTIHRKPIFSVPLFKLHGNITQKERTKTYFDFLHASSGILLCTDVASRGLDLPAVNWIVQYDAPGEAKEYLHRIGRTARLGHKGEAIIFLQPHEILYTKLLEKYDLNLHPVKGEAVLEHLIDQFQGRAITDPVEAATWLQNIFEAEVGKSTELTKSAIAAYQSHIRYYSTHAKEVKYIFHVKNLHLGHLARSFGLKEKPTSVRDRQQVLGGTNYAVEKQKKYEEYDKKRTDTRVVQAVDENKDFASQFKDYEQNKSQVEVKEDEEMETMKEKPSEIQGEKVDDGYESFDEVDETVILREQEQKRILNAPRKKLGPNERMKLYKDYTQGKIQRDRPKIVIPESLYKKKKKNETQQNQQEQQESRGNKRTREENLAVSTKGQGSGFVKGDGMVGDWAKLLRNPFQFRNKSKNNNNELTNMMLSHTSEFDSGLQPVQKKRRY